MPPTEALWFALSYCMRQTVWKITREWLSPWYLSFGNKRSFLAGWRDTNLWETSFCPHKMLWGMLCEWASWTITGIHWTANTDGNLWKCDEGQWCVRLSGGPHITGHASRLQSHFTAWHSIPILRRGFVSPLDDGFFLRSWFVGFLKRYPWPWANSISYNEWQFFLEIFNYGDNNKKRVLLTCVAEPPLQMFFIKQKGTETAF